ncbi:flagellar hook-associated protein 2 [Pseudalkalibacillus sp. R45]|uniref:flagellar hook-associated protein 2 n=1 Tax=Pseudalkalibacillus sp. R45 TaxID=3457433 RepID=UPI003FCC9562
MRIGGLASGMDIDQLVKDLMKAERIPLDKMNQDKQLLEWKRDDYREMNKLLKDLDQFIFDGVFRQSTFLSKSTVSSNESAVTATAGNDASATSTNIDVLSLAKAATFSSTNGVIDTTSGTNADTLLKDVVFSDPMDATTISAPFTLSLSVMKPGESAASPITLDIDPSTDSINDVMAKINSHTSLGVSAFYDQATNKVVLTMKNTGKDASIEIGDDTTLDFFNALGFSNATSGTELSGKTSGEDASFKINGFQTSRSSNTFSINDVTYNLKQVGSANISVTQDTDSIFDSIVKFVDKYNETIEKINGEIGEQRYRDFQPLTKEQREGMEDREVELWEEKAKSGMLRGDTILSGGLNAMRSGLYSQVTGANVSSDYNQLAQIGITTSSNYRDGGKLIIDPDKLKKAIQDDPNAVYELFMSKGTTTSEQGIARRLRDSIADTMDRIESKAGNALKTNQQFTMGRNLNDLDSRIDDFERKLVGIEDRYWRQFTAMEKAISRMNQQSMFLMNQFGGGM